jgi:hypothetical protein
MYPPILLYSARAVTSCSTLRANLSKRQNEHNAVFTATRAGHHRLETGSINRGTSNPTRNPRGEQAGALLCAKRWKPPRLAVLRK